MSPYPAVAFTNCWTTYFVLAWNWDCHHPHCLAFNADKNVVLGAFSSPLWGSPVMYPKSICTIAVINVLETCSFVGSSLLLVAVHDSHQGALGR